MNIDYDYSMYTVLCIVEISPISNTLYIGGLRNKAATSTARHTPFWYTKVPLDFYYNEQGGDIIYGSIMQTHYKSYPPRNRYIHIVNFMEELYQMHQSQSFNDNAYSVIVKFLTLVYPQKLREAEGDLKTEQYIFVLPDKYACDEQFLKETFRPALEKAAWVSTSDSHSKAQYMNNWQNLLYSHQSEDHSMRLQPEKKYILCDIQKKANQSKLLVTINTARMVYDPDFVKASQRSWTLLGENALLVPEILDTILHTELSFDCSLDRMKKFVKLIFLKAFAKSSDDTIGDDTLEDYYCSNTHYSEYFLNDFITFVISNYSSKRFVEDSLQHFFWNEYALTKEQREKLCKIEYRELYAIFEDENWKIIAESIARYIKSNINEQSISEVIINTENREMLINARYGSSWWHYVTRKLLPADYADLYLAATRRTLTSAIPRLNAGYTKLCANTIRLYRQDGYLHKVHTMINLANKLACPTIVGPIKSTPNCLSYEAFEFGGIIDRLRPYHYYVNVVINSTNTIQMSLRQVIETSLGENGYEKSTLDRLDHAYNIDSVYSTISDGLWDNLMKQGDCRMTRFEHYNDFKSRLTCFIQSILKGKYIEITDLDELVDFGYNHSVEECPMTISHRAIMDIGFALYIKSIISSIIAALEDKNVFGNYKASIAIITGDLLHQWLHDIHPVYSNFIWHQLVKELAHQTYTKQTRTNIILAKDYIQQHHASGYKPFERKKYQQVLSKSYFVSIEHDEGPEIEVYINHSSSYERVTHKRRLKDRDTWIIKLSAQQAEDVSQHGIKKSIYLHLKEESTELSSKRMFYSIGKDL